MVDAHAPLKKFRVLTKTGESASRKFAAAGCAVMEISNVA